MGGRRSKTTNNYLLDMFLELPIELPSCWREVVDPASPVSVPLQWMGGRSRCGRAPGRPVASSHRIEAVRWSGPHAILAQFNSWLHHSELANRRAGRPIGRSARRTGRLVPRGRVGSPIPSIDLDPLSPRILTRPPTEHPSEEILAAGSGGFWRDSTTRGPLGTAGDGAWLWHVLVAIGLPPMRARTSNASVVTGSHRLHPRK